MEVLRRVFRLNADVFGVTVTNGWVIGFVCDVLGKRRTHSAMSHSIAGIQRKRVAPGDCLLVRLNISGRFRDLALNIILPHQFSRGDSGEVRGIERQRLFKQCFGLGNIAGPE